jgi:serine/threonine-protein kinase RsbT
VTTGALGPAPELPANEGPCSLPATGEISVPITSSEDIVTARRVGRYMAAQTGQSVGEVTEVATAISEVARNIVNYAGSGVVHMRILPDRQRPGIEVIAVDQGPGIADVELALRDGFTTGGGLGLGLPGARRLMDRFHITSRPGQGTKVTMCKWRQMVG